MTTQTPATQTPATQTPAKGPKRHSARWIALSVLVVAGALVALLATRPPAAATEVYSPLVGHQAPPIVGTTLTGKSFTLASLKGRWVVVNFFASWCPPCQQEEPDLVAFAFANRGPRGVALVGVVFDDTAGNARRFVATDGATWPSVVDPHGQIALDYGVRGPPETFVIAPSGIIVAHIDGPVSASYLGGVIARAKAVDT